jgi:ParB family transcriptional regulator, chromosome partitioning protein
MKLKREKMMTPIFKQIEIGLIDPSKTNARKQFGNLDELAGSIEAKGVLEPLLVRPKGKRFEIVAGERRYRAGGIAKVEKLLGVV